MQTQEPPKVNIYNAIGQHDAVVAKSARDFGRMFGRGASKAQNLPQHMLFGMLGIKGGLGGAIKKFKAPFIFMAILLTLMGLAYIASNLGLGFGGGGGRRRY